MAILEIVRYPDPVLREPSQEVGAGAWGAGVGGAGVGGAGVSDLVELVRDMTETMYARNGAGLAAIQVGRPLRLFLVEAEVAGRAAEDPPMVFIDPEIVWKSEEKELADEGCLSFPGIFVPVERSLRCRTRAHDLSGAVFEVEGEGLFARAMQHEVDHLDGRLLADFVGRIKRRLIERRLARAAAANE